MTEFYDRNGEEMSLIAWATAYEDPEIRIVAVDVDDMENITKMVSTIWEGMPQPLSLDGYGYPFATFETALVVEGHIEERSRWSSEQDALEGHDAYCQIHLGRNARPEDRVRETIIEREKRAKSG